LSSIGGEELCIITNINKKIPDIEACCEQWFAKYTDILGGVPLEPPPLQESIIGFL
jgi:hypothetical protein